MDLAVQWSAGRFDVGDKPLTRICFVVLFLLAVLPVTVQSQMSDTELRLTGIFPGPTNSLVLLSLTNFQSRTGEVPAPLIIGGQFGDIEVISVNPARPSVLLKTASGQVTLGVGQTVRIVHMPTSSPTSSDKLYARYGALIPPRRFQSVH